MRIIPAIDVIEGKCVRLTRGDYSTVKIYNKDPLEIAKQFEAYGINDIHLVDLDGAKSKHIVNYKVLERIKNQTNLNVDFGGGLKSDNDLKIAFESGADQITGGSIAVDNPTLFLAWLKQYGPEKIILGADCKNRKIATHGWMKQTEWEVVDYINQYTNQGITYVICTDVMKDGMLEGPSEQLYSEIIAGSPAKLIASGGVSSIDDLQNLRTLGCEGVIIGKAIYEGKITLKSLGTLC